MRRTSRSETTWRPPGSASEKMAAPFNCRFRADCSEDSLTPRSKATPAASGIFHLNVEKKSKRAAVASGISRFCVLFALRNCNEAFRIAVRAACSPIELELWNADCNLETIRFFPSSGTLRFRSILRWPRLASVSPPSPAEREFAPCSDGTKRSHRRNGLHLGPSGAQSRQRLFFAQAAVQLGKAVKFLPVTGGPLLSLSLYLRQRHGDFLFCFFLFLFPSKVNKRAPPMWSMARN